MIKEVEMQIWPRKLRYDFKRSVCMGIALFIFVAIGAGCATAPPPEQAHVKIQSGQDSAEVYFPTK